ncbi:MAG TPA: alanine racemase [Candidatus Acidoferrales bacterium]|nr:alanine racemase [Candidatus Acidoferrales bacterium]
MNFPRTGRPTYAAIDAAALRHNFNLVRARVAPTVKVLAVVKADAYGHGAGLVAPILDEAGADWFGVATVEEALELRNFGINKPILILAGAWGADVPLLLEHDLAAALLHREMARDLAAHCNGHKVRVHIKVDTGMGRIGVLPPELPSLLEEVRRLDAFAVEGLFSHFGNSDRVDREYSDVQLRNFQEVCEVVEAAGFSPPLVHLANSCGSWARPDAHFTMVRPGIVLYGIAPAGTPIEGLRPAMRMVTHIIQLKNVPAEVPISYGQTFVTRHPSRIAVLAIGYADGYDRSLSNRGFVLVRGRRAPIVGTICMDLTMADVTDIPGAVVGDEVVLWGGQGDEEISVTEVGDWQGSVSYEVLTRLGKRVPRVRES